MTETLIVLLFALVILMAGVVALAWIGAVFGAVVMAIRRLWRLE